MSKILIIDDDDFVRGTYVTIFDQAGFEVVEARDGQEALEKIEKEIPYTIQVQPIRIPYRFNLYGKPIW